MGRFSRAVIITTLLSLALLALATVPFNPNKPIVVRDAEATLLSEDTEKGVYCLHGQWLLYPEHLVPPSADLSGRSVDRSGPSADRSGPSADLSGPSTARPSPLLVSAPGIWNDVMSNGRGYGTYLCYLNVVDNDNRANGGTPDTAAARGHAEVPATTTQSLGQYELFVTNLGTSYSFFVNGTLVGSSGTVGTSRETAKPSARPEVFRFQLKEGRNSLMFHVSNFAHPRGGLWDRISIARSPRLTQRFQRLSAFELTIFGSLLFIALYQLFLFFMRPSQRAYLHFALTTLLIALGNLVRSSFPAYFLLPDIGYLLLKRSQFVLYYLAGAFFMRTMPELQNGIHGKTGSGLQRFFPAASWFCVGLSVVTVVLPFPLSYSLAPPFYPVMLAAVVVMLYRSVDSLVQGERWEIARIIGISALFYGVAHDSFSMIATRYDLEIMPVASWLYAISFAFFLSRDFVSAITRFEGIKQQVIRAADEERRAVGRDLHDGVGQLAHAVEFLAEGALRKGRFDRSLMEKLVGVAQDVNRGLREIVHRIQPVMSADSLETAIGNLATTTEAVYRVPVSLTVSVDATTISDAAAATLYYIASESIANAVRHASPTGVDVRLVREGSSTVLSVANDGVSPGFSPRSSPPKRRTSSYGGNGLGIIAYRAQELGGTSYTSEDGDGKFVVSVTVPDGLNESSHHESSHDMEVHR